MVIILIYSSKLSFKYIIWSVNNTKHKHKMPAKKKKGGKKKRKGKSNYITAKRELEFKEEGQEYARVLKMLGDGRLEAKCSDNVIRICHIRGKMRKRIWINKGDLLLVDIRPYQTDKADIVHKYYDEEDRTLKDYGELINGTAKEEEEENGTEVKFGMDMESDSIDISDSSDSSTKDMKELLKNL